VVRIDGEHCRPLGKNYNFFLFVNDVLDILQFVKFKIIYNAIWN
jgi:hypothetical protein